MLDREEKTFGEKAALSFSYTNFQDNLSQTTAEAPFDDPENGDITIISSDEIRFHMSKTILSHASPFFYDMFSLHQPPAEAGTSRTNPSISFPEDGVVIDVLLRLCYPVDDPAVKDLRTIARVIMAAAKYQMDEAKKLATGWLRSQLYITPLPVYAIACIFNLEAEAAAAAKAWKDLRTFNNKVFSQSVEGSSYVQQMDGMSAGSYFRLLQYIRAPARSFDTKLSSFSQPQYTVAYHYPQRREQVNRDIPDSLFPDSFTQPVDFVLMSMDGYDFKVHRLVLELAGAHKLLEHAEEHSPDGRPISRINAMGWALAWRWRRSSRFATP